MSSSLAFVFHQLVQMPVDADIGDRFYLFNRLGLRFGLLFRSPQVYDLFSEFAGRFFNEVVQRKRGKGQLPF